MTRGVMLKAPYGDVQYKPLKDILQDNFSTAFQTFSLYLWRRKRFIFFLFNSEITMTILCNNGRKRDKRRRKEKEKLKEENHHNHHQCCCYCVLPTFSIVRGIKRCLFLSCYPFIRCLGYEDRRHRHHLHNHNHFL
ncbi:unnamed protein product [Brassica rapa subsp. trilocularis]|uniref:(rape) hypothetical protein n=1 Tax=Brassica napus TaxID=3708 RepID=A0A816T0W9_BRANA|nr:unnamed protein product [Brassica napus]